MNISDTIISIMEMNELKYFLAVSETENVNEAARKISISPGSISKAIAKLENEMGVKLFERVGRNIKITTLGRDLQKKASQIIHLEESTRLEIGGKTEDINIHICGEELLLSKYGVDFTTTISDIFPNTNFNFTSCDASSSIKKIEYGEAHIAFITSKPPKHLKSKVLDKARFSTCVGKRHPLHKYAKKSKSIRFEELAEYKFVVPDNSILGKTTSKDFNNEWNNESYKQNVKYRVSNIKILESLLISGKAIAYLPDYLVENLDVGVLDIIECPYSSKQTVYMICRDPKEISWLNQVW